VHVYRFARHLASLELQTRSEAWFVTATNGPRHAEQSGCGYGAASATRARCSRLVSRRRTSLFTAGRGRTAASQGATSVTGPHRPCHRGHHPHRPRHRRHQQSSPHPQPPRSRRRHFCHQPHRPAPPGTNSLFPLTRPHQASQRRHFCHHPTRARRGAITRNAVVRWRSAQEGVAAPQAQKTLCKVSATRAKQSRSSPSPRDFEPEDRQRATRPARPARGDRRASRRPSASSSFDTELPATSARPRARRPEPAQVGVELRGLIEIVAREPGASRTGSATSMRETSRPSLTRSPPPIDSDTKAAVLSTTTMPIRACVTRPAVHELSLA
jgi:hypothetical protein